MDDGVYHGKDQLSAPDIAEKVFAGLLLEAVVGTGKKNISSLAMDPFPVCRPVHSHL